MRTRYAIVWREDRGQLMSGKAEFLPDALQLEGLRGRLPTTRTIEYDDIAGVHRMKQGDLTVDRKPMLVLDLHSDECIEISGATTQMLLVELVSRLTRCSLAAARA